MQYSYNQNARQHVFMANAPSMLMIETRHSVIVNVVGQVFDVMLNIDAIVRWTHYVSIITFVYAHLGDSVLDVIYIGHRVILHCV
jgi:hypothetical protein